MSMKNAINFLILFIVVILFIFILAPNNVKKSTGKTVIVSTIAPLSTILSAVVGDTFTIETILPPGASPHTYEPSPSDIGKMKGAKVVFAIGHGIDDWSINMTKAAGNAKHVVVDKNIVLLKSSDPDKEGVDPHYFLAPTHAIMIAKTVADELSQIYPGQSSLFKANATAFDSQMTEIRKQVMADLQSVGNPPMATFHGAWNYFAADLGLTVSAVFEEYPGKEPTPQYLMEFEKQIRESGVKVIFAEPQFGTALIEPIAKDLSVDIATLDPEGGASGITTYEGLIRKNVDVIVKVYAK